MYFVQRCFWNIYVWLGQHPKGSGYWHWGQKYMLLDGLIPDTHHTQVDTRAINLKHIVTLTLGVVVAVVEFVWNLGGNSAVQLSCLTNFIQIQCHQFECQIKFWVKFRVNNIGFWVNTIYIYIYKWHRTHQKAEGNDYGHICVCNGPSNIKGTWIMVQGH